MPTIAEMIAANRKKQAQKPPETIEEISNYIPPVPQEEVVDADLIRAKLEEIKTALETTGAVRQPVIFVYEQIKMHPDLAQLLKPEDIGLLTRALRAIYRTVSATSATRKAKTAAKKSDMAQKAASVLEGIDLL